MEKFLDLCEQYDPQNYSNPKLDLYDLLKSKGIDVSSVRDTDMLYIHVGDKVVVVNVQDNDEDESINAGTGTYEVDQEVEKLGDKAASGLTGLAAKAWGTSAQKAKSAVKRRQNVAAKAVDAYDKGTQRIEKGLQKIKSSGISSTY